jgi:hypothetical protein
MVIRSVLFAINDEPVNHKRRQMWFKLWRKLLPFGFFD